MAQQTAVEWFAKITAEIGYVSNDIFEQAKEIEKEQIIEGFYEGMKTNPFDPNRGRGKMYYDETYKKD